MTSLSNTIIETGFEGKTVIKLAKHETYDIVLITLESGAKIPPHMANRDAQLIMLEGQIDFHIQDQKYTLNAHQIISFDKEVQHWVEAIADSKFILVK